MKNNLLMVLFYFAMNICSSNIYASDKPRVVVLTDAEIDDECSMVRFLLYANEWDIEGIITTSSQYHAHGHNWAGDDWLEKYLDAYSDIYSNLILHDINYPTPEYLRKHSFLGNVDSEGEMEKSTDGSQHIVKLLLDESDNRPIWFQAWGGMNTLSKALKTIEEKHNDKMDYVAKKLRFFFIWEQDDTYQSYIRPHWGKYNILTIISDQFLAMAYFWDNILPKEEQKYYEASWMEQNILQNHGPLCALYKAKENGDFRSEGDSPAFIYTINNGLRNGNLDHPDWGSWGGRYVNIRENTWLDPVLESDYMYPVGRWYTSNAWGRQRIKKVHGDFKSGKETVNDEELLEYLKPIWRWTDAFQNDFASRADWCVKSYEDANHPPIVKLSNPLNITTEPGSKIQLSANGTLDPDGDKLNYIWWQYNEAGTFKGSVIIENSTAQEASINIPADAIDGQSIHIICEVKDTGSPPLTRYQRIIVKVKS